MLNARMDARTARYLRRFVSGSDPEASVNVRWRAPKDYPTAQDERVQGLPQGTRRPAVRPASAPHTTIADAPAIMWDYPREGMPAPVVPLESALGRIYVPQLPIAESTVSSVRASASTPITRPKGTAAVRRPS